MTLTMSQLFLGAITFGIGTFRGTEAYVSFHQETLVGHANYAASKMSADHARASNVIANDNAISAAIMGPRFAVEADNITMDQNAMIACPQWGNPYMAMVCSRYQQNKPRALAKLTWVRAKQLFLWSALGKLSGDMDKVASLSAAEQVANAIRSTDSDVSVRIDDPSSRQSIWGGSNTTVACTLAQKDTLSSPMPGAAFPMMMPTLLAALPKALVQVLPQAICGALSNTGSIRLPEVPSVAKQTDADCKTLEEEMRCSISRTSRGGSGGCGAFEAREVTSLEEDDNDGSTRTPTFSKEVRPFLKCAPMTLGSAPRQLASGGYTYRAASNGALVTCTFDRDKCDTDKLVENTDSYLQELGLPSIPDLSSLGGSTREPSDADWNHSNLLRACAYASKPVDEKVAGLSDAVRNLASFGQAASSNVLRKRREYRTCGKWYFPDGPGSDFSEVSHDHQPFVAAWKWSLVAGRK